MSGEGERGLSISSKAFGTLVDKPGRVIGGQLRGSAKPNEQSLMGSLSGIVALSPREWGSNRVTLYNVLLVSVKTYTLRLLNYNNDARC